MRLAIMGAGGVGGCLGALLARAGNDVSLITRGEHLEAIRANGLKLVRSNEEFVVEANATDNPAQVGPVDLVLFTVKTLHNRQIISTLRPLSSKRCSISKRKK